MTVLVLRGCLWGAWIPQIHGQEISAEYHLKAIYLGRIPNFVQWPETEVAKDGKASETIRLCVVGSYSFGAQLAAEASKVAVSGRKMQVRWARKNEQLDGCHIIFVSRSEEKRYGKILESARGMNALTVGETDGFLATGGIVELRFENDLLKFDVNLGAAHAAGLKIDARLLAMAKRVIREEGTDGNLK